MRGSPNDPNAPADTSEGPLVFPPLTQARRVRANLVTAILRSGRPVPDDAFDEIYPDAIRSVSAVHWTPVRIAARVVELLRLRPSDRVLDVGAGVGKFCVIAAAMSNARVRGVERTPELVAVAREAVRRFGVTVDLVEGAFEAKDAEAVDAAYFFNPFTETIPLPGVQDFAADRFGRRTAEDVLTAERFLAAARVGIRVVTFCGFGGAFPVQYERLSEEVWDGGALEVWEKRS